MRKGNKFNMITTDKYYLEPKKYTTVCKGACKRIFVIQDDDMFRVKEMVKECIHPSEKTSTARMNALFALNNYLSTIEVSVTEDDGKVTFINHGLPVELMSLSQLNTKE